MSSGDKGVQGLQYLNYFSYSLKFLLLNVSLFYLKQDKRAFTTQIFPALVFSNEGGFYMSGNREYKSDVFSMLMQDKERALQLYNAMNGSSYDNPEDVEMVIHDGGISLSVRNDASFIVDARLSIYEHQSTVCPNMPVRSLIYFSVILSDMLSDKKKGTKKGKNIYGRRLVKIPTPHFVVFYNGAGYVSVPCPTVVECQSLSSWYLIPSTYHVIFPGSQSQVNVWKSSEKSAPSVIVYVPCDSE